MKATQRASQARTGQREDVAPLAQSIPERRSEDDPAEDGDADADMNVAFGGAEGDQLRG